MKKIALWIVIGIAAIAVVTVSVASFYVDAIAEKSVEKVGPMLTKSSVNLDGVDLSILSGGGSIKGLTVGNPEGFKSPTAIKVGNARLELSPGSLLSDKIVIRKINVQAPEITFESDLKGNNLSKLLANIEEATGGPSDEPGKKLQVDDFVISDARMSLSLTHLGGKTVTVVLPDIHLQNLGQGPEGITPGSLVKQVFAQLETSAVQAAAKATAELGTQAVGAAKDAASSAADAVKGVGGLFKRK